jgi:hypothetical protein
MPDTHVPAAAVEITAVVQTYLDGLYEGDADKLAAAFHPTAELRSAKPDGTLAILPRDTWLEGVRTRPSAASQGLARHDRILSVEQHGPDMAVVQLSCAIPPRFFTDTLVLLKLAEGWRVVSKVFRTDTRG